MIAIELNRFDFARMENPDIENWEYQKGRLAGFSSVEEAVSIQQNGKRGVREDPLFHVYADGHRFRGHSVGFQPETPDPLKGSCPGGGNSISQDLFPWIYLHLGIQRS